MDYLLYSVTTCGHIIHQRCHEKALTNKKIEKKALSTNEMGL